VSQDPIDVIRAQYAAVNERDFARAMDHYSEDVVLVVPQAEGVPSPGTYEGKVAVGNWFGDWFLNFDRTYRLWIDEARDLGKAILIVASHAGTGRASGVEVRGSFAYLYRVESDKVTRVEFFATRPEALEAAGVPEQSKGEVH
jgi:ketosteroid isomerase-like protein